MVFSGLTAACLRARLPTSLSPDFVKATTEGVVRDPSALGMTTGSPPSMTAITEFVVPRSIPTVFGICSSADYVHWIRQYVGRFPSPLFPKTLLKRDGGPQMAAKHAFGRRARGAACGRRPQGAVRVLLRDWRAGVARSFDLDPLEGIAVGTIGPPGQRQFFLRAAGSGESL